MEQDKQFKKNFIWNTLGTGVNAFNSLFFMIAVTRLNGIDDAGIFSIAFSTACIIYVLRSICRANISSNRARQINNKQRIHSKQNDNSLLDANFSNRILLNKAIHTFQNNNIHFNNNVQRSRSLQ